ncbi:MAG: transglutaminase family protein, partial [Pseudomonadota bacterium]
MKVALTHSTRYHYDKVVGLGPQVIRLRPAPHCRTKILSYSLKIKPDDHFLNWQQDAFANYLARVVVPEKTKSFEVDVDLIVDLEVINPFDFFLEPDAETFPFAYDEETKSELKAYLEVTEDGPLLKEFLKDVDTSEQKTIDFLVALNQRVETAVDYVIRMEPGVQTCEETLQRGRGSCRDSSWLLVQVLRHLGLAARFASGYLIQLTPDKKALDGPQGTDHDFTDLHAWAEVYLPGAGWIGLDPTSGLLTGEGHIPLACAPKPTGAAPISGTADDADVDFSFDMKVTRLNDGPRITKPFPDEMWADIDALGDKVEAALTHGDVRLTTGGEPTFVAIDNVDEDEWNTEAVGPTKRDYADTLIRRLRDRFAPGGLLHYGQGKWYPGESLPRWAFGLYWRADGEPLWQDESLIAEEGTPRNDTVEAVETFTQTLADMLELNPDFAQPVYEDPVPFMGQEARLPYNVNIAENKLDNPEDRARIVRVFNRGLRAPTGYVLPIQRQQDVDRGGWRSEMWRTRRGKLFLLPGDSPVGFRLPIEALPWVPQAAYPFFFPADPFAPPAPLPQRQFPRTRRRGASRAQIQQQLLGQSGPVRTAMSVEVRNGHMCVFLPPTEQAADYIDLVYAIEATAAKLGQPVHVEGYMPPTDTRLNVMKVTPDPGVIEVNVQPAK